MGHASTAVGELYTSPLLRLRALGFMGGYKQLEAPLFFGGDQTNNTWLVATQIVFIFAPILGKRNPFWRAYFSKGLEPPTSFSRNLKNTKNKNIWRPKDGIKHDSVCFLSVKIFFCGNLWGETSFPQKTVSRITPLKTNMTGWKTNREWRCIFYWQRGFSIVMLCFQTPSTCWF